MSLREEGIRLGKCIVRDMTDVILKNSHWIGCFEWNVVSDTGTVECIVETDRGGIRAKLDALHQSQPCVLPALIDQVMTTGTRVRGAVI